MLRATFIPYRLLFRKPATTSRSTMDYKDTYFVKVWEDSSPEVYGLGEVALFKGLSVEDSPAFENVLQDACEAVREGDLSCFPSSIRFGLETALSDLANGGKREPFLNGRFSPVPINGLVWMDTVDNMLAEATKKIDAGFRCIKFKIGAHDFDRELQMIAAVRRQFAPDELEIRLDANGAFKPADALSKLEMLAPLHIHSIEQPIKPRQWVAMSDIVRNSPVPVALDEELIGITPDVTKRELLATINPKYIILKPSLCGGFSEADNWIATAQSLGIGWWATSALESNVGLNAIARWCSAKKLDRPQGLGTGQLFLNNIPSPLAIDRNALICNDAIVWDTAMLSF